MLNSIDIASVLFFDVECVTEFASYEDLNEDFKYLWQLKTRAILKKYNDPLDEEAARALYSEKAAIFAEFGKIVCISVGIVRRDQQKKLHLRLKSFADDDEKKLLKDFSELLGQYYNPHQHYFCGHNIKEFDVPYICRRMLKNQMPFPKMLQVQGKKPWETKHLLDTMDLWTFGDRKNYTSLKLLAGVFGFPSPKDDIDGSEVGRVYWQEEDLPRIATYCEKDVLATVQLFLKYKLMPVLADDQITIV